MIQYFSSNIFTKLPNMSHLHIFLEAVRRGRHVHRDHYVFFLYLYLAKRNKLRRLVLLSKIRSISNKYYTSLDLRNLTSISPWDSIASNLSDRAFMSFLNLDVKTFFLLHTPFSYYYNRFSAYVSNGRRRSTAGATRRVSSITCLAIVLNYFNTVDKLRVLQVSFLLPPSTCSVYLNFGVRCLSLVIDVCIGRSAGSCPVVKGFKIEFPTKEERLESWHQALLRRYPRLSQARGKAFGFLDGTKVRVVMVTLLSSALSSSCVYFDCSMDWLSASLTL